MEIIINIIIFAYLGGMVIAFRYAFWSPTIINLRKRRKGWRLVKLWVTSIFAAIAWPYIVFFWDS